MGKLIKVVDGKDVEESEATEDELMLLNPDPPLELNKWGTKEQAERLLATLGSGILLDQSRRWDIKSNSYQHDYVVVTTLVPADGDEYEIRSVKQEKRLEDIKRNLKFQVTGMIYSTVKAWDVPDNDEEPADLLVEQTTREMRKLLPTAVDLVTKIMTQYDNFYPTDWKDVYDTVLDSLRFNTSRVVEEAAVWPNRY